MNRIIVSVTNDLSTDQRVDKVCNTLYNNNFDVLLVGRKLKNSLPMNRKYATKRIKLIFNKGFLFYAEYSIRLFLLLSVSKKDTLLSNDLDTLLPNFLVSRFQNKKLVYDSHELFTEVPELINRSFVKSVWARLENWILPKLKNCYTVSKSIAIFYTKKYGSDFKVIRNFPTYKEIEKSKFTFSVEKEKTILYQGAVNLGRGLTLMLKTMKFLNHHTLVIIGDGDILPDLEKIVLQNNLYDRVTFLGKKTPEALQKLTPLADIGISLEEDFGLNYRFALPNKIFDYIQAEIPVLVSNLPEMKKIITHYNVGEVVTYRTPKKLASQIENILKKDFTLSLKKAKKELIWENEEKKLLGIFNNLL